MNTLYVFASARCVARVRCVSLWSVCVRSLYVVLIFPTPPWWIPMGVRTRFGLTFGFEGEDRHMISHRALEGRE